MPTEIQFFRNVREVFRQKLSQRLDLMLFDFLVVLADVVFACERLFKSPTRGQIAAPADRGLSQTARSCLFPPGTRELRRVSTRRLVAAPPFSLSASRQTADTLLKTVSGRRCNSQTERDRICLVPAPSSGENRDAISASCLRWNGSCSRSSRTGESEQSRSFFQDRPAPSNSHCPHWAAVATSKFHLPDAENRILAAIPLASARPA